MHHTWPNNAEALVTMGSEANCELCGASWVNWDPDDCPGAKEEHPKGRIVHTYEGEIMTPREVEIMQFAREDERYRMERILSGMVMQAIQEAPGRAEALAKMEWVDEVRKQLKAWTKEERIENLQVAAQKLVDSWATVPLTADYQKPGEVLADFGSYVRKVARGAIKADVPNTIAQKSNKGIREGEPPVRSTQKPMKSAGIAGIADHYDRSDQACGESAMWTCSACGRPNIDDNVHCTLCGQERQALGDLSKTPDTTAQCDLCGGYHAHTACTDLRDRREAEKE